MKYYMYKCPICGAIFGSSAPVEGHPNPNCRKCGSISKFIEIADDSHSSEDRKARREKIINVLKNLDIKPEENEKDDLDIVFICNDRAYKIRTMGISNNSLYLFTIIGSFEDKWLKKNYGNLLNLINMNCGNNLHKFFLEGNRLQVNTYLIFSDINDDKNIEYIIKRSIDSIEEAIPMFLNNLNGVYNFI